MYRHHASWRTLGLVWVLQRCRQKQVCSCGSSHWRTRCQRTRRLRYSRPGVSESGVAECSEYDSKLCRDASQPAVTPKLVPITRERLLPKTRVNHSLAGYDWKTFSEPRAGAQNHLLKPESFSCIRSAKRRLKQKIAIPRGRKATGQHPGSGSSRIWLSRHQNCHFTPCLTIE